MENVIAELAKWDYLQELPPVLAGFTLEITMRKNGLLYEIFSYANSKEHRNLAVVYDSVTKDFLVRITVGLTEFCDISFISTKLVQLEAALRERMESALMTLSGLDDNSTVCSIFRQKKILEWPYATQLPENLQGFELFIRPARPLKVINGSYIIIDYSDFAAESNLLIYYNIFRDEFFGEVRVKRTPQMTACFDAAELSDLAEKMEQNLEIFLQDIRMQLNNYNNKC